MPLQDFYLDYLRNRLEPGEFVQALRLPLPGPDQAQRERLRVYKLSKRRDCDISGLSAGLWLRLDGDRVVDARFAFGGMASSESIHMFSSVSTSRYAVLCAPCMPWFACHSYRMRIRLSAIQARTSSSVPSRDPSSITSHSKSLSV